MIEENNYRFAIYKLHAGLFITLHRIDVGLDGSASAVWHGLHVSDVLHDDRFSPGERGISFDTQTDSAQVHILHP